MLCNNEMKILCELRISNNLKLFNEDKQKKKKMFKLLCL